MALVGTPRTGAYDAVIGAVAHREFQEISAESLRGWGRDGCLFYGIRGVFADGVAEAWL